MSESLRRERDPELFGILPAVPAVAWLCCGIVAGCQWRLGKATGFWGMAGLLLGLCLFWACRPRRLRFLALLAPLGLALALWHETPSRASYRHLLLRPACGASVRGILVTPEPIPLPGIPLRTTTAEVVVRAMRVRGSTNWHRCSGRLLVLLPPGVIQPYGIPLEIRGVLLPPDTAPVAGAFDYARYLRLRKIHHLLQAHSVRVTGTVTGWRRLLAPAYAARRRCGRHLASAIANPAHCRILVAMSLGFRQGLPADLRDSFVRSGAIHIFAISGLHVCIVWSFLRKILRLLHLSYGTRHLAIPLLLGGYVVMTGSSASAVRAWTMITILCLARGCLRTHSPLNAVAVAALVLLVANPLQVFQSGFQFSFAIVTILILGWPHVNTVVSALGERRQWIPRSPSRRPRIDVQGTLLGMTGAAFCAWLGSSGLVAVNNGLIIPGALLINIVLSVLAWLTLALAVPKIIVSALGLSWLNLLAAKGLTLFLGLIESLVQLGSLPGASIAMPVPPAGILAAYYLGLGGMLWPRITSNSRLRFGILFGLACVALLCAAGRRPERLAVWYGGETQVPVLLACPGSRLPPVAANAGGTGVSRQLEALLRTYGYSELDLFLATSWRWGSLSGSTPLLRRVPPACIGIPPGETLPAAASQQRQRGGRVRQFPEQEATKGNASLTSGAVQAATKPPDAGNAQTLTLLFATGAFRRISLRQEPGGRLSVTWTRHDGNRESKTMLPAWRHPLRFLGQKTPGRDADMPTNTPSRCHHATPCARG